MRRVGWRPQVCTIEALRRPQWARGSGAVVPQRPARARFLACSGANGQLPSTTMADGGEAAALAVGVGSLPPCFCHWSGNMTRQPAVEFGPWQEWCELCGGIASGRRSMPMKGSARTGHSRCCALSSTATGWRPRRVQCFDKRVVHGRPPDLCAFCFAIASPFPLSRKCPACPPSARVRFSCGLFCLNGVLGSGHHSEHGGWCRGAPFGRLCLCVHAAVTNG